jgi:DNA-binding MarR family transcriptional regulator
MERELAAAGGLSLSEYDVLLNMAEGPRDGLRPTDLAERIVLTKSGLTRLLDRLVELGYVERRACPSDRRGQLVVLTASGRRAFKRAAPTVVQSIATFFTDVLDGRDIASFARSCERVTAAAEALTA